jgi:alpha-tubulin suppressor-like RCC1 family protein
VKCWGTNTSGQLGYGDTVARGGAGTSIGDALPAVSLDTAGERTAIDITAGSSHTCVLLDNNTVKCWGLNSSGQLGLGNTSNIGDGATEVGDGIPVVNTGTVATPVAVRSGASASHTCVIYDNGKMKCFGAGTYGRLGSGGTSNLGDGATEVGDGLAFINLGGAGVTAVDAVLGTDMTCVLTAANGIKCFGRNNRGQIGIGSPNSGATSSIGDTAGEMSALASVNLGSFTPVSISMGSQHVCAVSNTGTVKCWGYGLNGALGLGNTSNYGSTAGTVGANLPLVSLGSGTALWVGSGQYHNCALMSNFDLRCWGYNNSGQLGRGSTSTIGDAGGEMGTSLVNTLY